MDLAKL